MKAMYAVSISIKEARDWLRMCISERASIPNNSICVWVAGVKRMTSKHGCYLVAGVGGFEGVVIIQAPAVAQAGEVGA